MKIRWIEECDDGHMEHASPPGVVIPDGMIPELGDCFVYQIGLNMMALEVERRVIFEGDVFLWCTKHELSEKDMDARMVRHYGSRKKTKG